MKQGGDEWFAARLGRLTASRMADVIATTQHGFEVAAIVGRDNIFGAQFHPEKSHKFGMKLLENFSKI